MGELRIYDSEFESVCDIHAAKVTEIENNLNSYTVLGTASAVRAALMASFYRMLKREFAQAADHDTPEQARMDKFTYIEAYLQHLPYAFWAGSFVSGRFRIA